MFKKLITTIIVTLLVSMTCTVVIPNAWADIPPVIVYVDPPQIVNQALTPGTTFNISINIGNIPVDPGLVGAELHLQWDPAILSCEDLTEVMFHEVTPPSNWSNIWTLSLAYDNTGGTADYSVTWMNLTKAKVLGYAPISGNHTAARLMMKVKSTGKSALHLFNTKLGGPPPPSPPPRIDHQTQDGFFSNAPPPPPALIYVDPPKISNLNLTPCNNFTINVDIVNATDLQGLEFKLGFNTSILNANSVTNGSFIPPSATLVTQIDNTVGFVLFNVSVSSPLNGDGILAEISFHVEGLGGTPLHIYGVQLIDSFNQTLPYMTADGSFDNVLLAKLAVDPPDITDPTLVPPATFMINVTIADVRDLYGYQFDLTFDPNVLICLQVEIHDVLNETHYIPNQNIDNLIGSIFVNVTYYEPAIPLDVDIPTPLVTIKFRVKAIGATDLNLTDTGLIDHQGQDITHEVHNGHFQSLIVDIAVIDLYASPTAVYPGKIANITVTVINQGNSTQSFGVNLYYNSTLLATVNVTGLAPGANATKIVEWNTTGVSYGKYLLSANVPPLPYETDTADNTFVDGIFKVKIPGDINNDDVVDIFDAVLASEAYGSKPGDPNWNPDADLNGDGLVDIYDMIILSGFFGRRI